MVTRDDEFWINAAVRGARNTDGWMFTADALKRSADVILETVNADRKQWLTLAGTMPWLTSPGEYEPLPVPVWQEYMLLAGFAIENLVKGIQIARNPALIRPDPSKPQKLLPPTLLKHLDLGLIDATGIKLTTDERDLVSRLTVFVLWGGRYPVSTDALQMRSKSMPDGSMRPPATSLGSDPALVDVLFDRLRAVLMSEIQTARARAEVESAEARKVRRRELLSELVEPDFSRETVDGVVTFTDKRAPSPSNADPGGTSLACCGCSAQMNLTLQVPAAICRCGTLHHAVRFYDGSLKRELMNVESYPPAPVTTSTGS